MSKRPASSDYTQHAPHKRHKSEWRSISVRYQIPETQETCDASPEVDSDSPLSPETTQLLEQSGLLDIVACLNFTVKIEHTLLSEQLYSVAIDIDTTATNEPDKSSTVIKCIVRAYTSPKFDVADFFIKLTDDERTGLKRLLARSSVPRTIGGWGMQTIGATARFIAGCLGMPLLTLTLTDHWDTHSESAFYTTDSSLLQTDEQLRASYAAARFEDLGVNEADLIGRLKMGGFYGIWGFEPQNIFGSTATVGPAPGQGTLLETKHAFGAACTQH